MEPGWTATIQEFRGSGEVRLVPMCQGKTPRKQGQFSMELTADDDRAYTQTWSPGNRGTNSRCSGGLPFSLAIAIAQYFCGNFPLVWFGQSSGHALILPRSLS